jgi:hypothetical protein
MSRRHVTMVEDTTAGGVATLVLAAVVGGHARLGRAAPGEVVQADRSSLSSPAGAISVSKLASRTGAKIPASAALELSGRQPASRGGRDDGRRGDGCRDGGWNAGTDR